MGYTGIHMSLNPIYEPTRSHYNPIKKYVFATKSYNPDLLFPDEISEFRGKKRRLRHFVLKQSLMIIPLNPIKSL